MAEIKQINVNNVTYDINLPSKASVDVAAVKANSITDTSLKGHKVIGTSANGVLEAHELAIPDVKDLQSALNGKAPSSHTHTFSSVTSRGEEYLE